MVVVSGLNTFTRRGVLSRRRNAHKLIIDGKVKINKDRKLREVLPAGLKFSDARSQKQIEDSSSLT